MIKIDKTDCLEWLKEVKDNSVDLVVIDPPYNIRKDSWDDIENYELWIQEVILELQRVLKDNGSFYMFHSEMEVVSDLMIFFTEKTNFIFKQFIVWNKRFTKSKNKGFLDGYVVVDALRNYQQMAEYILFYTFQKDDSKVLKEIREYLREEIIKSKGEIRLGEINSFLGTATSGGGVASSTLSLDKSEPTLITEELYIKLKKYVGKEYLKKEWKELKKEFCNRRFCFNNLKTHHSVWNYDLVSKKDNHITPKPRELIKNIILHSSNEGDLVLDCFLGTGTTAFACKELNRDFIGCDNNEDYVNKIKEELKQTTLCSHKI